MFRLKELFRVGFSSVKVPHTALFAFEYRVQDQFPLGKRGTTPRPSRGFASKEALDANPGRPLNLEAFNLRKWASGGCNPASRIHEAPFPQDRANSSAIQDTGLASISPRTKVPARGEAGGILRESLGEHEISIQGLTAMAGFRKGYGSGRVGPQGMPS